MRTPDRLVFEKLDKATIQLQQLRALQHAYAPSTSQRIIERRRVGSGHNEVPSSWCLQRCYIITCCSHAQASKYPQRHGPQKLLLCAETSAMSWTAGIRAESESEQTQRLEGRVIVSEVLDFFACSKAVAQNAALAALAATGAWQHSHLGPCRS